jgi:endonuclease/exonuclease/phosphatase family metal-dependent hydrolase
MRLCFISSNIRFDNPADGVNAWPYRRSILGEILLKHHPDIIATQEGRFDQLMDFQGILGDYLIIDDHRSWIKERMYPTFFIRKNVFEVIRSEDRWLSETPQVAGSLSFGSAFPRLMTWIKIQPKNSDVNFVVVNTHLDHMRQETRKEQMKVLSGEIGKVLDTGSRLIVMGDFNDSPESDVRAILMSQHRGLQDSWKLFHSSEETSHHAFSGECQNGSRIDWILVDEKITVEECFLEKGTVNGCYPSDHFPVVCHISF